MKRVVCCALPVMLLIAGCASQGPLSTGISTAPLQQPADPLVRQLRDGGYILYFRHGKTEQALPDQQTRPNFWKSCDSRISRPLSDEGRQQMLAVGKSLRELRIPVDKVVTSEYCRAFDSGLLLQLMPVVHDARLNFPDAQRAVGRNDETMRTDMRTLLSTPPPPGRNVILMAHVHGFTPVIDTAFHSLVEGEAAVVKPGPDGKIEVVGRITVEKWAQRAP